MNAIDFLKAKKFYDERVKFIAESLKGHPHIDKYAKYDSWEWHEDKNVVCLIFTDSYRGDVEYTFFDIPVVWLDVLDHQIWGAIAKSIADYKAEQIRQEEARKAAEKAMQEENKKRHEEYERKEYLRLKKKYGEKK